MEIPLEDLQKIMRAALVPVMGAARNLPTKGGVIPRFWNKSEGDFDVRIEYVGTQVCPGWRVTITDDHGGDPYACETRPTVREAFLACWGAIETKG